MSAVAFSARPFLIGGGNRRRLTAPTLFYVNASTGSDTNNGRSSIFPKRNIQEMIDDLYLNYDCGGFDVFIQLAGHFTAGIEIEQLLVGQRNLTIGGNPADVTAVRIDIATTDKCVQMIGGNLTLQDLTLSNKGNGDGIYCDELAFLTTNNLRFEDVDGQMLFFGGGSHLFVNAGSTITVAGSGRNFVHHTGMSEVSFEDANIDFIQNPISGNYPTFSVYLYGGNNSTLSFNRAVITGQKAGPIVEHFAGLIKNAPTSGNIFSTFYPPGMITSVINTGGAIYADPVQPNTYVGLTGNDLSEGYTAALPVLNFSVVMALMAKRYTSNQLNVPPVMQVNDGSYSASIVLLDIPGCPLAYCRGNPTTPANCVVKAIQNRAENTYWIVDGFTFHNATDENYHANGNSKTGLQNCVFELAGPTNGQIVLDQGGFVEATGPLSITGGGGSFISNNGGQVVITQTVTIFNAIVYGTATVVGDGGSLTRWTGTKTLSGGATVTAPRVNLKNGARVNSNNTSDQTSIPGSTPGPVDSGTFASIY